MSRMSDLLGRAVERGASDLHLNAGLSPVLRIDGNLQLLEESPVLTVEKMRSLLSEVAGADELARLEECGEVDFSYALSGCARFRLNAFRRGGSVALIVRIIGETVPTLASLGLPEIIRKMTRKRNGLILATGAAGSGKTTTLAAMIDAINQERRAHIITLEDPIEYLHKNKSSIINQREIRRDTLSFNSGLRAALREDPDVIMVGEMRDPETIATVITAAETGHLVLATLHTASAAQAVDRIIDAFAPHQQLQLRLQLSMALQMVIAQRLLPLEGGGRAAASEILVCTPAVRNMIREGKSHQLAAVIQSGARAGMQSLENSLCDLYHSGRVRYEEIVAAADDEEALLQLLGCET